MTVKVPGTTRTCQEVVVVDLTMTELVAMFVMQLQAYSLHIFTANNQTQVLKERKAFAKRSKRSNIA